MICNIMDSKNIKLEGKKILNLKLVIIILGNWVGSSLLQAGHTTSMLSFNSGSLRQPLRLEISKLGVQNKIMKKVFLSLLRRACFKINYSSSIHLVFIKTHLSSKGASNILTNCGDYQLNQHEVLQSFGTEHYGALHIEIMISFQVLQPIFQGPPCLALYYLFKLITITIWPAETKKLGNSFFSDKPLFFYIYFFTTTE